MRVVLDTNVIVSSCVFGRRLSRLREAWTIGRLVPVMCGTTADELVRVLAYSKFNLTAAEQGAVVTTLLPRAELREPPIITAALQALCRDRADLIFIALAQEAGVPLVSGDKDISSLKQAAPVEVLSAAELISRLSS